MRHVHKGINKEVIMMKCQWKGCDYESHKNSSLDGHVRSSHEGFKYKCRYCEHETEKMVDLLKHQRSKHEPNKHLCNQCNATFKFKHQLDNHIESAHLDINFPCSQCEHSSTCKKYLNEHFRRAHGSKYQCELCEYVAKRLYMLKCHMNAQHGQASDSNMPQTQLAGETSDQSHAELVHQTRPHQPFPPSAPEQTAFNLPHTIFDPAPNTPTFIPPAPTSTQLQPNVREPVHMQPECSSMEPMLNSGLCIIVQNVNCSTHFNKELLLLR